MTGQWEGGGARTGQWGGATEAVSARPCRHVVDRRPLVLQDVQADPAVVVDCLYTEGVRGEGGGREEGGERGVRAGG